MEKHLKVVYENGVLLPLEPVSLQEHQQYIVTVLENSEDSTRNEGENCYELALKSGIVGIVKDAPSDLSTNQKYFEGFGRDISINTS